jgi:vacuolar-type H+-ATPase subunit H
MATKRTDSETAKRLVSSARAKARKLVVDARAKAKTILAAARAKARKLVVDARTKAKTRAKMAAKKPPVLRKARSPRSATTKHELPRSLRLLKAYNTIQTRLGPGKLVSLSALRAEVSDWPRDLFNRELAQARTDQILTLQGWGGRTGKIPAPLVKGAIREGGELLVFAKRP